MCQLPGNMLRGKEAKPARALPTCQAYVLLMAEANTVMPRNGPPLPEREGALPTQLTQRPPHATPASVWTGPVPQGS